MMSTTTCETARPRCKTQRRIAAAGCDALRPTHESSALSRAEEWTNSFTHGLGLVLSLVGAALLISRTVAGGDAWRTTGCVVFAATLIAVYAASTLSHFVQQPRWRFFLRTMDQALIYLLIVGTYTPFALSYLRDGWWLGFLGLMWGSALLGFTSKLFFAHRVESVTVWSYVGLGWMLGIAVIPLWNVTGLGAIAWLFAGGMAYTVGTLFLMNDRKVRHFHAVWHLLVLCGSGCHFVAICLCLMV